MMTGANLSLPRKPRFASRIWESSDKPQAPNSIPKSLQDSKPIPPDLLAEYKKIGRLIGDVLIYGPKNYRPQASVLIKPRYGLDGILYIVIQCEEKSDEEIIKTAISEEVQRALGTTFSIYVSSDLILLSGKELKVYAGDKPLQNWCGMGITIDHDGSSSSATLGGLITVVKGGNETVYGLTVGHALTDMTKPSKAPLSVKFPWSTKSTRVEIGDIIKHDSFDKNSLLPSLDCALINFHPDKVLLNKAPFSGRSLTLASYSTIFPVSATIITPTLSHDGSLASNSSVFLVSSANEFVETYDFSPNTKGLLRKGDSGSWVINERTGEAFGHIVSVDMFGEACVVPLECTLQGIKAKLQADDVRFPGEFDFPLSPDREEKIQKLEINREIWTDSRKRCLIRLYLFTALPTLYILRLLAEHGFTPSKEQLNKLRYEILGCDSELLRPKDDREETARISNWLDDPDRSDRDEALREVWRGPSTLVGLTTPITSSTDGNFTKRIGAILPWMLPPRLLYVVELLHYSSSTERELGPPPYWPNGEIGNDIFNATYAVPGDLLNDLFFARKLECAASSSSHAAGICWCKIESELELPPRKTWAELYHPKFIIVYPELAVKDAFGNTPFHFLASQEERPAKFLELLSEILTKKKLRRQAHLNIHDTNAARQNFLHTLHATWFEENSRLQDLLTLLHQHHFDIALTDVYGRSIYHVWHERSPHAASPPDWAMNLGRSPIGQKDCLTRRDAFGYIPRGSDAQDNRQAFSPSLLESHPRVNMVAGGLDPVQRNLMATILESIDPKYDNNDIEDDLGRNSYHYLAIIDSKSLEVQIQSMGNEWALERGIGTGRRHEYVKALHRSQPDHYDKDGQTPLMAFLTHSREGGSSSERNDAQEFIKALIGAGAPLEQRNGRGETAIHVAARHGSIAAVQALMELGANTNTRNACGQGVLEVLHRLRDEDSDIDLALRRDACYAILTSPGKAVFWPTICDEWVREKTRSTLEEASSGTIGDDGGR